MLITSDAVDKLLPAWRAARSAMHPAAKSAENKFDKYYYATEGDWHDAVQPALEQHDLVLSFSVSEACPLGERPTHRGGTEYAYQVFGCARLTHVSGQWVEVSGFGHGQDRADKGIYKATTGLKKYLYALLFSLPTTDDPERDESVGQSAPPTKPSPPAKPAKFPWATSTTEQRAQYVRPELDMAFNAKDSARIETIVNRLGQKRADVTLEDFDKLCKHGAALATQLANSKS